MLTGIVRAILCLQSLVALVYLLCELITYVEVVLSFGLGGIPFPFLLVGLAGPFGWGSLLLCCRGIAAPSYAVAMSTVFALGVIGGIVSTAFVDEPLSRSLFVVVELSGFWILNSLGALWLWGKYRRIRIESNRD